MNERIRLLSEQAEKYADDNFRGEPTWSESFESKFAELIVEECRTVVVELYHKTPLELCGPLLTADEKIAEHFYGVE